MNVYKAASRIRLPSMIHQWYFYVKHSEKYHWLNLLACCILSALDRLRMILWHFFQRKWAVRVNSTSASFLLSQIYLFRVAVVSPAFGGDTNQKKWNTDCIEEHGLVFSRIHFFYNISSMTFGFCFGFSRICKCWGTSFLVYDREMYSIECYQMLFRKRECPSTRESTKIWK